MPQGAIHTLGALSRARHRYIHVLLEFHAGCIRLMILLRSNDTFLCVGGIYSAREYPCSTGLPGTRVRSTRDHSTCLPAVEPQQPNPRSSQLVLRQDPMHGVTVALGPGKIGQLSNQINEALPGQSRNCTHRVTLAWAPWQIGRKPSLHALLSLSSAECLGFAGWRHPGFSRRPTVSPDLRSRPVPIRAIPYVRNTGFVR